MYEWHGLKIDVDGRVTEIDLSHNQLEGSLPTELGDLDQLRHLKITHNSRLSGAIPREFGRLTRLRTLNLESNRISGPIPHEIGLLPHLQVIRLSRNDLSGELPPSILSSATLSYIDLTDNELTGVIPADFSVRSRIYTLRLGYNQLTGQIPKEIGELRSLNQLWLNNNRLVGDIPESIDQLKRLDLFSISNNQLTGRLPAGITTLRQLVRLDFDNNQLTGSIPEELGNLRQLERLGIAGNDFSGCVPSSLREVERNNVAFANVAVCGQPDRTAPALPAYIKMVFGNSASPAETLAAELGAQWIDIYADDIGWPAHENTITVYVDNWEGLYSSYAGHVANCDYQCARDAINSPGWASVRSAAFVPLSNTIGGTLEMQASLTAQLIFSAMQLDLVERESSSVSQHGPLWFDEGLATLISMLAVNDGMHQAKDAYHLDIAYQIGGDVEPLWDLEEESNTWREYRGAAAVNLLASQVGLPKLAEFYTERTIGESWKVTFGRVFNISIPDFYELFNQHQRDGLPFIELPAVGSTNWP